jgi:hypothetical protein
LLRSDLVVNAYYRELSVSLCVFVRRFNKTTKKENKAEKKRWLFEEVINNYRYCSGVLAAPI